MTNGKTERGNGITPYPWQSECLAAWKENGRHGIVNVITGAGKTFFAIAAAQQMIDSCGGRAAVAVIVPTIALAMQWKRQISSVVGQEETIGLYCGSVKARTDCRWMIYVVNSARHTVSRHILAAMEKGKHVLLICDECHRYTGNENRKIFDFIGHKGFRPELYSSIGLSATPGCAKMDDILVSALGKIIYSYSFARGVDENTVSRFALFQISVRFTYDEQLQYNSCSARIRKAIAYVLREHPGLAQLDGQNFYYALQKIAMAEGDDSSASVLLNLYYERRIISILAERRTDCAEAIIRELPDDTRLFIFCERIDQAAALYEKLNHSFPCQSACYHSGLSREARSGILSRFRNHEYRILICCKALDEGLDVPDASAAIVLSGTAQERQRIQRLGRILRKSAGKQFASLYYCHVTDSAEDWMYLPELDGDFPTLDLQYHSADKSFEHPKYLDLANELLSKYRDNACTEDVLSELRTCLLLGQLLPDWLEPPEILRSRAETETDRRRKNYYYTMDKLSQLRLRKERAG